ncbi:hypothetical protein GCM10027262_75580 [Nocardia tengchongensis]
MLICLGVAAVQATGATMALAACVPPTRRGDIARRVAQAAPVLLNPPGGTGWDGSDLLEHASPS